MYTNNKIALVTLIEASILLSDEDKLELMDEVPAMTDQRVEALGKFLSMEREFAIEHETAIRAHMQALLDNLDAQSDKRVYVGTGKPL